MDGQVSRAQGGRPKNHPLDPEMAQGGCIGGRPVVGDKEGYAPGSSGRPLTQKVISNLNARLGDGAATG